MIVRIAGLLALTHCLVAMASPTHQTVLAPDNFVRPEGNLPTLEDLLTLETRASIFYSYSRETDMSARFAQEVQDGEGTTLFVPTNKAVQALARKPHEDPKSDAAASDAEHEAISKSNVQRWVGAHIVPSPNVNFTSTEPYDTLTSGATIAFQSINKSSRPSHEPHIETDAAHLASVKGSTPQVDTDAAHLAGVKDRPASKRQCRRPDSPRADAAHLSSVKGPAGRIDTDAAHIGSIKGPASPDRAPQPDTDAAHFASVKGPASPDRVPQSQVADTVQKPIWKQYEMNDGVNIIDKKQASNGVMYLIDGTVAV